LIDFNADESVRISLRLAASETIIDAFGTVIWRKGDRQGIQFSKLTKSKSGGDTPLHYSSCKAIVIE
jgi:hypothetical protein